MLADRLSQSANCHCARSQGIYILGQAAKKQIPHAIRSALAVTELEEKTAVEYLQGVAGIRERPSICEPVRR